MLKSKLRKKILEIRKLTNSENRKISFTKVLHLMKKNKMLKKKIGGYYPVNFEVNTLEILKEFKKRKYKISLPVTKKNFSMDFYEWNSSDPLIANNYGIPEPRLKNLIYPDVILVPLVAFDKNLYRLGYGGGYYDRYLEKISKKKSILTIGMAFSFQKINNIPVTRYDKRLNYIVTDKFTL